MKITPQEILNALKIQSFQKPGSSTSSFQSGGQTGYYNNPYSLSKRLAETLPTIGNRVYDMYQDGIFDNAKGKDGKVTQEEIDLQNKNRNKALTQTGLELGVGLLDTLADSVYSNRVIQSQREIASRNNEYIPVPTQRYGYQSYLDNPYTYQSGGLYETGGYLKDKNTYVTKDGKETKRGLWANVYLKNKKQSGGTVDELGYLDFSPYKNANYLDINSNNITMDGVSQPLFVQPDFGKPKVLAPNSGNYYFPNATKVREIPLDKMGRQDGEDLRRNYMIPNSNKPMNYRSDTEDLRRYQVGGIQGQQNKEFPNMLDEFTVISTPNKNKKKREMLQAFAKNDDILRKYSDQDLYASSNVDQYELWKQGGRPQVNVLDKKSPVIPYFNDFNNSINIKKHDNGEYNKNHYLSEIAHAIRHENKLENNVDFLDNIPYQLARQLTKNPDTVFGMKSPYNTPGNEEYETHKVFQPLLKQAYSTSKFANNRKIDVTPISNFETSPSLRFQTGGVVEEDNSYGQYNYSAFNDIEQEIDTDLPFEVTNEGQESLNEYSEFMSYQNSIRNTIKEKPVNSYNAIVNYGTPTNNYTNSDSISVRHQNAGNLKYANWMKNYGAVKGEYSQREKDGSHYALFPNYEASLAAQKALLTGKNYKDLTVPQALNRYAAGTYTDKKFINMFGDRKVKDLNEKEIALLQKEIIRHEDANTFKNVYGK